MEILNWLDAEAKLYDEQGLSADYEHSCKLEAAARLIRALSAEVSELKEEVYRRDCDIEGWIAEAARLKASLEEYVRLDRAGEIPASTLREQE